MFVLSLRFCMKDLHGDKLLLNSELLTTNRLEEKIVLKEISIYE